MGPIDIISSVKSPGAMGSDSLATLRPLLEAKIRAIPDFPITGILFRDIMPILHDPALFSKTCSALADHCRNLPNKVEAVAGLEARGFLFGPQIAMELGVPFVPIRKKGKLPGKTVRATYVKEYGEDVVEIQTDALSEGSNVFIFDDLLATGGTMSAAINLIEKAGGKVVEAFCLIELVDLKGRAKLPANVSMTTLIHYEGE